MHLPLAKELKRDIGNTCYFEMRARRPTEPFLRSRDREEVYR